MLVRDLGDHYQLVLQPDHGELSGQIARAWIPDPGLSPRVREALIVAAARHDEGWAVWERHPRLDPKGRPQVFHSVARESLLSSYRACVDVLAAEDRLAGLLVSMHVSGLQRNRYGVMDDPGVPSPHELEPAIREFVQNEERRQDMLIGELEVDERERWRAYRLLQVYDVASLYLGMADITGGESTAICGDERALKLTPTSAPWTVHSDPFTFESAPAIFTMRRLLLAKRTWDSEAEFRADFSHATPEQLTIRITPSG